MTMGPEPMHDPTVKPVEEFPDVGAFVVLAPTPQEWIQRCDQFRGRERHFALSSLPYLVHEATDRLLLRVRIKRTFSDLATNLIRGKIELPLSALDFVAQELETVLDMDHPRLLRM